MNIDHRVSTTGGNRFTLAPLPETARLTRGLVDRTSMTLHQWEELEGPVREGARSALLLDLEQRTSQRAKSSPRAALDKLSELGFAWRNVADLLGVSVAAVNKWRRGEGITGPNRMRISRLLALLEMLETRFIDEPASWLEMPIQSGVALQPLDLLVANRYDLVLELAGHATGAGDYETILNEFNPTWRTDLVDEHFETFTDSEGVVAIRPKATV